MKKCLLLALIAITTATVYGAEPKPLLGITIDCSKGILKPVIKYENTKLAPYACSIAGLASLAAALYFAVSATQGNGKTYDDDNRAWSAAKASSGIGVGCLGAAITFELQTR